MVFILLIAISFFAKSDVILGHSTPSSTLLTSTFFPTYPVFSCTGSLSQNRDQSLSLQSQSDAKYERPLFTFGSQSDASLNSTLERLKVLSEYSKAGSDFGEFAQIKSFDFDQVSEIVRLVFGVDISNLEVAERDDQSRDDESMDDLSKYSTAGGKIGELADIKSFDHDQTFEVANRQFGMNITKSENAKIKKVVDFYEFFSIAEVAFCAIGDMIHIIGGFYKNPGCIVCDCLDNLSILRKCEVIGVLSQILACSSGPHCPIRHPHPIVSDINTQYVNLPFMVGLPTPKEFPEVVIREEMRTYHLLWQSIAILSYNAEEASCGQPSSHTARTLEGWEHVYTVNLGSVKHVRHHEVIPFARLAKRVNANDNCLDDYLITFRETQSAPEWGINVSYNQILEGDTLVHRGFHTLARGVFALFNPFLRQADEENRLGLMTVTGHSLGGGVGAVFSYLLTRFYPKTVEYGEQRIRAVLFAQPPAGGSKFVTELANNVIFRSVISEFDPVPKIPCSNSPYCVYTPIPTGKLQLSEWQFNAYPGLIQVLRKDLPEYYSRSLSYLKVALWHVCAYECWLSRYADPQHPRGCVDYADSNNPHAKCRFL